MALEPHTKHIWKRMTRRSLILGSLQLSFAGLLALRMKYLQIEQADQFRLLADENRINIRLIPPKRGEIYDRNGIILAENVPNYRITLIKEDAGDVELALENLSKLVSLSQKDIERTFVELNKSGPFLPVTVTDRVSWNDISRIAINTPALPGITPEVVLSRRYPLSENFTHIVGYVGPVSSHDLEKIQDPDPLLKIPRFQVGKARIEFNLEDRLRGRAGSKHVEVNSMGRVMRELEVQQGEAGENFKLTVNADLQCYIQARLGEESASAVVLDCQNGDILAMTSAPSFDPNKFVRGISYADYDVLLEDRRKPLVSKAIQGTYPPGSTFKMITALAALENGIISPSSTFFCSGHLEISGKKKYCWKKGGHGKVNLARSIRESCDVFYYDLALKVGIERIGETARKFGLGIRHEVGVSVEAEGLIPSKEWKQRVREADWFIGDTANAGIGQGDVLASPLQLAVMSARLATGKNITPTLIKSSEKYLKSEQLLTDLDLEATNLKTVRKALSQVVNDRDGTAYKSRIIQKEFRMAGKTGTSQVFSITAAERQRGITSNKDRQWHRRDHALFVCYAPIDNPKVAVSVVVEHGGGGSKVAAPIARDIVLQTLYGNDPPYEAYPVKDREEIKLRQKELQKLRPNLNNIRKSRV